MYCGGCFRDNALVAALRRAGHEALMVPLYLPLTLDEADQSAGTPIFFGGINVYLEQQSSLFARMPRWLHRVLSSPRVLRWAAGRAARTRAADVGDLTLSMLRGEEGRQARELDDLVAWLKRGRPPDVVCLSNALLAGLARQLQRELRVPVVCFLSGEDTFLDGLPESVREEAWDTLAGRARGVDVFVAPSRYYADLMSRRLGLRPAQVRVVPNGIRLEGFTPAPSSPQPPVLGYFARLCPEKGLDTLVEAYLLLRRRPAGRDLRLHVGGGCGPADEPFVRGLQRRLAEAGVAESVRFLPNVDRTGKFEFFRGLTVFSVPALYGEAFGLYLLEAWASGVPVVQPRHAAFPELIEATGGGLVCAPGDPVALADALERVIADPARARELGARGLAAVERDYSVEGMASRLVAVCQEACVARKRVG
jgi:glycosyltransferase involved in cell wall biosynthesis